jgi:hypothetical protein
VAVHLLFDPSAQLSIGWGNLAHSRALVRGVHRRRLCKPRALKKTSRSQPFVLPLWRAGTSRKARERRELSKRQT